MHTVQEVARVNSIAFHPSGDFILAGTDQPTCRCGGCAVPYIHVCVAGAELLTLAYGISLDAGLCAH